MIEYEDIDIKVKTLKGRRCEYEGCRKRARVVAGEVNAVGGVGVYCDDHYQIALERANTFSLEHIVECPNCGCAVGV